MRQGDSFIIFQMATSCLFFFFFQLENSYSDPSAKSMGNSQKFIGTNYPPTPAITMSLKVEYHKPELSSCFSSLKSGVRNNQSHSNLRLQCETIGALLEGFLSENSSPGQKKAGAPFFQLVKRQLNASECPMRTQYSVKEA